jgi:cobyrinic acid a,c-diamide synthase
VSARALIVGAARSGSGKTSVSIGLMRALQRRGLAVRGAKSGPDYIDPGFHEAATGAPGVNLDSWAMPPGLLDRLAAGQAAGADVMVIESAMGLYDGIPAEAGRSGSAAELARRYGIPVLLILDVSGQSQTVAAIARGFATHDPAVRIAGIVLNQVASERHERLARDAIAALGLPVVGAVHRNPDMALPERHLGLVQAREHAALEAFIERLADVMERSIDLDAVLSLAAPLAAGEGSDAALLPPPGQRIAIAEDAAFSFVYPHVARHWRNAGAELVPFSPLADEGPGADCDACWLPGGYPELHAGRLRQT